MAAAWTTLEKTYAMIKPDAVGAGNAELILRAAEDAGFIVVKAARTTLSRERAGEFYAEHRGKPFFPNLVSFMSSGPIVAVCLAKTNAIADWRALMGPTNTLVAREEKPKSLRALYGTDGTKNATHGSDSLVSASRELKFFFPNLTLDPVPEGAEAREFIKEHLTPTLVKGLAALCKERPSAHKLEATQWLADWLRANNPNRSQSYAANELVLNPEDEEGDDFFGTSDTRPARAEDAEDVPEAIDDIEQTELNRAATKVQSRFRGYQSRKNAKFDRQATRGASSPAVVVRSHTDATENEFAAFEPSEENVRAASIVQANYRGHAARRSVGAMRVENARRLAEEEEAAAVKIQAAHRGRAARRDTAARAATAGLVSGAMDSIFQTDAEENAAAAIVQASYRGHKTRMDLKRAKELEDEEATAAAILEGTEEETAAAIKIQAVHRGRAARADAAIRAAGSGLVAGALGAVVDAEENEAATKLQCSFRGHQDRKRVAAMRAAAAGDGEEDA